MKNQPSMRRFWQFSIQTVLILTLIVAAFLGGRLSMQGEIHSLQSELDRVPKRIDVMSLSQGQPNVSTSQLMQRMLKLQITSPKIQRVTPESIEQGMKASELEMYERRCPKRSNPHFSQGRQRANIVIAGTAAAFLEATQKQFVSRISGVCAVPAKHIRDFVPA